MPIKLFLGETFSNSYLAKTPSPLFVRNTDLKKFRKLRTTPKLIASFSAILVTSLPSFCICLSLSLSHTPSAPHAQYRKRFRASYNKCLSKKKIRLATPALWLSSPHWAKCTCMTNSYPLWSPSKRHAKMATAVIHHTRVYPDLEISQTVDTPRDMHSARVVASSGRRAPGYKGDAAAWTEM